MMPKKDKSTKVTTATMHARRIRLTSGGLFGGGVMFDFTLSPVRRMNMELSFKRNK